MSTWRHDPDAQLPTPEQFAREIRDARRFERGLTLKAVGVLAIIAILLVLHELVLRLFS